MYTQRFSQVTQRLSIVHTPVVFSQFTQTQLTCPATRGLSFQISPSSSSTSSNDNTPGSGKTVETKSTQTALKLNPKESNLELKVLNVSHRVIDPLTTKHKAVQTMEESPSRAIKNASIRTSDGMVTKLMPSTGMPADVTSAHELYSSSNTGVSSSNTGVSNEDTLEEERRKKEELLAKLRAIDGVKNPPESLPIESATARGFKEQTSQSGAEKDTKSGGNKQAVVEEELEGKFGPLETVNKLTSTGSQQKANYDSLWSTGHSQATGGQTPGNNLLQRSPLFPESSGPGQGSSSHQNTFSQLQGSGPDQGSSSHQNPFSRSQAGQGSSHQNTFSQVQGSGPGQGSSSHQNPSGTSQLATMQSNGKQNDIANLLLGESQPFQAGLTNRVTGYRSVNSPERSLFNGDPLRTTGSSQPLSGPNSVVTRPQAQSSLFNFTGGQMTKGSTDLSTLMQEGRRTINLSSPPLQDEARRPTLPLDFTKKLDISSRPDSRHKKESTLKPSNSRSSISSLQSWPDTVQNLHTGKPAYSTESDPFGSKHAAVIAKSTNNKPVHGRRAGTLEEIPDNLGSISENHPGSTVHQTQNIKPRSDSQSYPWEVTIDVEAGKAQRTSGGRTNSTSTKSSLLPLRPKQNGLISAPNSVVEPDDLEQVML